MVNDFSKEVSEDGAGDGMVLFNIADLTTLDPTRNPSALFVTITAWRKVTLYNITLFVR